MVTEAEFLATPDATPLVEVPGENTNGPEKGLPFPFAKRHGVLVRTLGEDEADVVYRASHANGGRAQR